MANARDVTVFGMAKVALNGTVGHALAFATAGASRRIAAAVVAGVAVIACCLRAHVFKARQALARELVRAHAGTAHGVLVAVLKRTLVAVALEVAAACVV